MHKIRPRFVRKLPRLFRSKKFVKISGNFLGNPTLASNVRQVAPEANPKEVEGLPEEPRPWTAVGGVPAMFRKFIELVMIGVVNPCILPRGTSGV